jgi:CheY-like chemotaxis protein
MTAHAMKGDRERCLRAGMDGYISKPIQMRELFETIESLTDPARDGQAPNLEREPGGEGETDAESAGSPDLAEWSARGTIFDKERVLHRVEGDRGLLKELADLLAETLPGEMAALKAAILARDAVAMTEKAHAVKGIVGTFAASLVSNAAFELEKAGRRGDLNHAEEQFAALESAAERLQADLARFLAEDAP